MADRTVSIALYSSTEFEDVVGADGKIVTIEREKIYRPPRTTKTTRDDRYVTMGYTGSQGSQYKEDVYIHEVSDEYRKSGWPNLMKAPGDKIVITLQNSHPKKND